MIARAVLTAVACAGAWVAILGAMVQTGVMSKEHASMVGKTALAAALGAILPMLPGVLGDSAWGPLVSAVLTAIVLHLAPPRPKADT